MKKFISILVIAIFTIASSFAFDMSIGLKGTLGADNSEIIGCAFGGGLDINLDLLKGFGVQIESNIATSTITSKDNGITVEDNLLVQLPVMAWYNARFNWFGFGLGAGMSCVIPENTSNIKLGLASGARIRFFVSENFAISFGASGNLDCFPTLVKTTNGNSKNYKFENNRFIFDN